MKLSARTKTIRAQQRTPANRVTAVMVSPASDESKYLRFSPFDGDRDVSIECRTVVIVTTNREHWCAASTLVPPDYKEHNIPADSRAWKESAKVEGQFGSCYCCLPCLDALMNHETN